jgi:hypothetical protein
MPHSSAPLGPRSAPSPPGSTPAAARSATPKARCANCESAASPLPIPAGPPAPPPPMSADRAPVPAPGPRWAWSVALALPAPLHPQYRVASAPFSKSILLQFQSLRIRQILPRCRHLRLRARQLHRRHRALFHLDAIVLVQPLRQVSSVPRSTRMEPSALDARAGGGGATMDGVRFRNRRRGSRIPKLETLWVDENRYSRESPRRGDYPITLDKLL